MIYTANTKERKTQKIDLSPNVICLGVGVSAADTDMEFYDSQFNTVLIVDFKHNGLTDSGIDPINMQEKSITYQTHKAERLGCAACMLITYTKPGEQPIPMFYCLPLNKLMRQALITLCQLQNRALDWWLTPRQWSQLVCQIAKQPVTDRVQFLHQQQSNIIRYYQLPKIICSKYAEDTCACYWCGLSINHNKRGDLCSIDSFSSLA